MRHQMSPVMMMVMIKMMVMIVTTMKKIMMKVTMMNVMMMMMMIAMSFLRFGERHETPGVPRLPVCRVSASQPRVQPPDDQQ